MFKECSFRGVQLEPRSNGQVKSQWMTAAGSGGVRWVGGWAPELREQQGWEGELRQREECVVSWSAGEGEA